MNVKKKKSQVFHANKTVNIWDRYIGGCHYFSPEGGVNQGFFWGASIVFWGNRGKKSSLPSIKKDNRKLTANEGIIRMYDVSCKPRI